MTRRPRHSLTLAATAAAVLLLAGCASPAGGDGGADAPGFALPAPNPPSGEVLAQGTVLDTGGEVQLCLGPVAESFPPQCDGIPLEGWTWEGVDGSETAGDVRFGAYAVAGTYDGDVFTVAGMPIMLALYDPLRPEDPTGGEPGSGEDAQLEQLQSELPERLGDQYLSSYPADGWLWVQVVWDDGTWQDAADAEFGPGVVIVQSALTAVSE